MARRKAGGAQGTEFTRARAFKGFSYAHEWRGTLVVRGWPKKRGNPKSATTKDQNNEFARLIQSIKHIDPDSREAARQLAEDTAYTYRDILIMAATGTYIQIEGLDNVSIQQELDQITSTPGAMLVRTDMGWVALMPGNDGDRLRSIGAGFSPVWQAPPISSPTSLGEVIVDDETIVVDGDGVISATPATVPIATDSVLGRVKPDTVTTVINAYGVLSATAAAVPAATGSVLGKVKPDGTTITVDGSGAITATAAAVPIATTSILGKVKPDGTTITIDGAGKLQAVNTITGAFGLYSSLITARPTIASMGFTGWMNQGTATEANTGSGVLITVPPSAPQNLRQRTKPVPASVPYYVDAMVVLDSHQFDFSIAYIGWTDLTKTTLLAFRHANGVNQIEVDNFTSATAYSNTPAFESFKGESPILLRIWRDATNLFFEWSTSGDFWNRLYVVSEASSFLGSGHVTYLCWGGNNLDSRGCGANIWYYKEH